MKAQRVLLLMVLTTTIYAQCLAQTIIGRQRVDQYPITAWGTPTYGLTWLPTDYDSPSEINTKYPLIIFLHGAGEGGDGVSGLNNLLRTALPQLISQGFNPEADNPVDGKHYKFIVVSPQAPSAARWSYAWGSIQWILPNVINRYRIDTTRIYVTGLSAGGAGTWSCVTNGPDAAKKFAAIAPISAAGTNSQAEADQLPLVGSVYGSKVWSICGANDAWMSFSINATNTINNAIPAPLVPAIVTGIPGADHNPSAWNTAYSANWRSNSQNLNLYEWLLKWQKSTNAPSASAGANQTITLPTNQVSLNGSGIAASGNTIASYAWTKVSGPSSYTIVSPSAASTNVTNLVVGTYTFRLTVTDNLNATASSDVIITVNQPPNVLPSANAGADLSITLPVSSVTLNGSGSDPDGTIASYNWSKISGPTQFTIVSPNNTQTTVNNLTQGTYQFQLTVTDDRGGTAKDTVVVTVNPAPNVPPTANAGNDQVITLPTNSVILNGSGIDSDGTIASYQWTKIDGPVVYTIVSPSQAQTTVSNLVEGTYRFELSATDDRGAVAKDTVSVTVNPAPNQPPVANAGGNQTIVLPVNNVTLNGSGTDPEGNIASYAWTKVSGPASYIIVSPSSASTNITNLVAGIYTFRLTVTDNLSASASSDVIITVNQPPNVLPSANAGADLSITLPVNSVTLSGSGNDPDGTIASYSWSKISGPAQFTIVSPNNAETVINNLVEGSYQFELRVTDNNSAISTDTVIVVVNAPAPPPVNSLPVASAGIDQTITLPLDSVQLNGSGVDSDGTISGYNWAKISGPSAFVISNPLQSQAIVRNLVQGVYQFELTVTDNNGGTGKDTVSVQVNAAPNTPPVANAGSDAIISLPIDSVVLDGSGFDLDGAVVSYAWKRTNGPSNCIIIDSLNARSNARNLITGVYSFELTVTDNEGAVGKDTITVTVNAAPNMPPTANAGADQTTTLPVNSVTLLGNGNDTDGTISSYLWKQIGGPLACKIVDPSQAQTLADSLEAGIYSFELTVTDNSGATAKDTVQVTVNQPINIAPVVNAGSDITLTLPDNSIDLSGSASDSDGSVVSFTWVKVSGPTQHHISTPNLAQTSLSNLIEGLYRFELQATDNDGAIGRDTISVTVNKNIIACNGIKRYMVPGGDGGRYMNGNPSVTTWYRPINPGDTIVLSAQHSWNYFSMAEYSGTAQCPIVIQNEGGQVWLTAGIETNNCKYIKITGSGDPNTYYGFKVYNPAFDGNGVAISIVGKAKNIEVERIDVYKKTYGVWAKQDPQCDQSYNYPNYIMDSIEIHHSRFKNIGQDCIYAGNTDPLGQRDVWCNGQVQHYIPMRLSNINIHHLIIDSCNRTGIQLGGANSGYNQIHNNVITRCGYEYNQQQGTGIAIGGMTRNCHVYNNTIKNTFLYGIMSFGVGTNYIENNIIDSTGWLDGVPNTWSRPCNILASPKETLPFDSTRIIIRNNKLGLNCTTDNTNVALVLWGPSTWATGNVVCSNTLLDAVTPAKIYIHPSISYINDCSAGLPPLPPSVYAGKDIIVNPVGDTVLLGTASDPDGTIASYQWTKISGPAQFTINSPDSINTTISNLTQGVYVFRLTVMDDDGLMASDDIIVSVAPPNIAPVANAGPNQIITLPLNAATMAGSGNDPDGTIASYQWTNISGPASFTIVNVSDPLTQINNLVQGTYLFELVVTDNNGAQDRDTVSIRVNPAPPPSNVPPTANAGSDISITLPTNFAMLSGSGTDPDGSVVSYQWTKISGPASFIINNASQVQTSVGNLVEGTYQFELKVTDNVGAVATDIVIVTVNPLPNTPPLANAGADQFVTLPVNTTTLNGMGNDAEGVIVSFTWTKISGPAQYSITSLNQAQTTVTSLVQGVYQFELMAIDAQGATGRDTVTITVNPKPIVVPVAYAGADITITLPTSTVPVRGVGIDADGTIVSYQWSKISGPSSFTIGNAASAQTFIHNMVEGVYHFELMVTDDDGATGRDTIMITVNPANGNLPPVANAGNDQVITLPVNSVTLTGNGTDVDGVITEYSWTRISGPVQFNIVYPSQKQTSVTGLVAGTYQFELKVTDDLGAVGRDTINVVVNPQTNYTSTASLYPNPASSTINVKIDAVTHRNQTRIRIYDVRGLLVYEEEYLRTQPIEVRQIDVSKLSPGAYIVMVGADINNDIALKFIKE